MNDSIYVPFVLFYIDGDVLMKKLQMFTRVRLLNITKTIKLQRVVFFLILAIPLLELLQMVLFHASAVEKESLM